MIKNTEIEIVKIFHLYFYILRIKKEGEKISNKRVF